MIESGEKLKFKDFPSLVDEIIKDFLDREKKERKFGEYYPSEISYCIRLNYFAYTKPKKHSLDTLKVFECGSLVHNWVQNVLFKGFTSDLIKKFDYEESLVFKTKDFVIRGRYDDLVAVEFQEKPILLEVKTARSLKYISEPKKHHVAQINFYLTILKLKVGYIIYFDRTNLKHKIFRVEQSEEMFNEMVKRAEVLHSALKNKKIPPPESKMNKDTKWLCNWCLWRLECLEGD